VLGRDGTLVYVAGGPARRGARTTLVWVDRQGGEMPIAAPPRAYVFPRVSPDGTRVAVTVIDETVDLWVWDLKRPTLTPVTSGPGSSANPIWMSDGRRVVFTSNRAGVLNLFSQKADGTGTVERLTESPNIQNATAVTPDGLWVVFTEASAKSAYDVMALRLDGTHQILPLVQTPFDERNGIVSPDGRWLAYEANDSGAFENVRPYPDVTRERWPVSTNGGTQPLWARGGRELFYVAPDGALMRVAVTAGPAWTAGAPTKALEGRYVVNPVSLGLYRNYDLAADGQRFLMLKASSDVPSAPPQIIVVQHFDEELKRLVPTK